MKSPARVITVLGCCLALVNGNPAAGKEWIWKSPMPKLSVNPTLNSTFEPETSDPYPRGTGTIKVENCGPKPKSPRIVGGMEVEPHSYPWQVGMFINRGAFCGGFLISDQWVLTAGHCTNGAKTVNVIMGAHNIKEEEPTQVKMMATEVISHDRQRNNDIGLIKLPEPITFNEYIQPICLPSYSECDAGGEFVDMPVTATGWGLTSDSENWITDKLRKIDTKTISVADCKHIYGSHAGENYICISTEGGHGTCGGDSGGPLNYWNGVVMQTRGVTSFGPPNCESGQPDGFTRICNVLSWIETNTGIAIDP